MSHERGAGPACPGGCIDITKRVEARAWCTDAARLGIIAGCLLLLVSLAADRRFLLGVAAFWLVASRAARGSRLAAAVQLVGVNALGWAVWVDAQRLADAAVRYGSPFARRPSLGWVTAAVIAFAEVLLVRGLVGAFRSGAPRPAQPGPALAIARRRVARTLALRHADRSWRAVANYLLAVLCAFVVFLPSLPVLPALAGRRRGASLLEVLSRSPWWVGALVLLTVFAGLGGAAFFYTRAKRSAALSAAQLTARDARRPVLLLRSFRDDLMPLRRAAPAGSGAVRLSDLHAPMWTLEETLERALSAHGPVVAIGRPGESVPPAGAARRYVPNDRWLARVQQYILEAQLVVVVLGNTEGLRHEYAALAESGAWEKLIAVFPPSEPRELATRWATFLRGMGVTTGPAAGCPPTARVATFSRDGAPCMVTSARADEPSYELALAYALHALGR